MNTFDASRLKNMPEYTSKHHFDGLVQERRNSIAKHTYYREPPLHLTMAYYLWDMAYYLCDILEICLN